MALFNSNSCWFCKLKHKFGSNFQFPRKSIQKMKPTQQQQQSPTKVLYPTNNFVLNSRVFKALDVSKVTPKDLKVSRVDDDDDLFKNFKGLLILGRVLGIMPISGVFSKSYRNLHGSLCSLAGLISCVCIALLALDAALAIRQSLRGSMKGLSSTAAIIQSPVFSCWGCFIYAYVLLRRHEFLKIFKAWAKVNRSLTYQKRDRTLHRTIVLIAVIMFSSTVLENAVLHMEFFEVFDDLNGHNARWGKDNADIPHIEMYYYRSHGYWNASLGYHPVLSVMAFLVHKCVLYGWNYIDVTSALFFRALYWKFKALCKAAEESLVNPVVTLEKTGSEAVTEADRLAWERLASDHSDLCDLLTVMNRFFSPLLFVSYTINIYFFCMQLLLGLSPNVNKHSIVHSIYAPWSFIHIILRVFILSLCASKINEFAHKIRDVVMKCPVELHKGPIEKLDKRVNMGPKLGMTGLGCFVITKPFMLNILNVVFTVEIVLLQGVANEQDQAAANNNNGCPGTGNNG